jgi:hypothetical protein
VYSGLEGFFDFPLGKGKAKEKCLKKRREKEKRKALVF